MIIMAYQTDNANVPPQKLSRYRSTRHKPEPPVQTSFNPTMNPPTSYTDPTSTTMNSMQRSRSRYRRATQPSANGAPPPLDPTQMAKVQQARQAGMSSRPNDTYKREVQAQAGQEAIPSPPVHGKRSRSGMNESPQLNSTKEDMRTDRVANAEERARLEARRILENEADRQQKLKERMKAQEERDRARRQAEREDMKRRQREEEEAKREAEDSLRMQQQQSSRNRLQRNDAASNGARNGVRADQRQEPPALNQSGSRELFGIFKRKRGDVNGQAPPVPAHGLSKAQAYQQPFHDAPVSAPANRGGMEAPISAVNAGERVRHSHCTCVV